MDKLEKKIINTVANYIVPLILFVLVANQLMIIVYKGFHNIPVSDFSTKLVLCSIYATIVSLVIKNVLQWLKPKNKKWSLLYLLSLLLATGMYYVVFKELDSFATMLAYFSICGGTTLTFFVIPFINKVYDSAQYTYRVLVALLITALSGFVLGGGINLILLSIHLLFEINIAAYIYLEITIFIGGFILPTVFLAQLPNFEPRKEDYPNFLRKLFLYVIYPILSIYTVILYAYFIRILVTFSWPANILGNLIIYYTLIATGVLYFTYKLQDQNSWAKLFNKYFPYLLIIPALMMGVSFMIRINEYGLTEARYYAILIMKFTLISIFILKKVKSVKYLPLVLAGLLITTALGPLSATNMAFKSQEKRFTELLIQNKVLVNNKLVINKTLKPAIRKRIYNNLIYLSNFHELNEINYLPHNFEVCDLEQYIGPDEAAGYCEVPNVMIEKY